jgi:outer membrane protein assembly factor BamB
VAPDRYMTALDAQTGRVVWRSQNKALRVRESMGLSADKSLVYVKTMDGQVVGISTRADSMQVSWKSALQLPYELSPSAIVENKGIVYVPTHSGLAAALDRKTGKVLWQHKISNGLLNPIMPFTNNRVVVSAMDGKLTCLEYRPE